MAAAGEAAEQRAAAIGDDAAVRVLHRAGGRHAVVAALVGAAAAAHSVVRAIAALEGAAAAVAHVAAVVAGCSAALLLGLLGARRRAAHVGLAAATARAHEAGIAAAVGAAAAIGDHAAVLARAGGGLRDGRARAGAAAVGATAAAHAARARAAVVGAAAAIADLAAGIGRAGGRVRDLRAAPAQTGLAQPAGLTVAAGAAALGTLGIAGDAAAAVGVVAAVVAERRAGRGGAFLRTAGVAVAEVAGSQPCSRHAPQPSETSRTVVTPAGFATVFGTHSGAAGGSPADTQVARSNSMNARVFSCAVSAPLRHSFGKYWFFVDSVVPPLLEATWNAVKATRPQMLASLAP